jgi:autotransporter-associated beta strand protein
VRTFTITDGTPAIDVSIAAAITGAGGLTKVGAGTLQFSAANTYTGVTTVAGGLLTLSGAAAKLGSGNVIVQASVGGSELQILSGVTNAIANSATLSLADGSSGTSGLGSAAAVVAGRGFIDLGTGINETVNMLLLNGIAQGPGTYGSSSSAAMFKSDNFFTGAGILTVAVPEPASVMLSLLGLAGLAAARRRWQ